MVTSAIITLIAFILLVGIAIFAIPASIRHQRQTDDGRHTPSAHRFDDYDEHPSTGKRHGRSSGGGTSSTFYNFG